MKKKYQKPMARGLAGISAAEGACFNTGGQASGSACTTGASTQWCSPGGVANITGYPGFCSTGSMAANCYQSGSQAGG